MPAASAEKRARQRANKLLRMETETTTLSNALPPTQPSKIISESLSTPAPTFFTISYTPVSISYPEPINSTAPLPTDAIRVTRDQLADMLHQSYVHGSEQHEKVIVQEAFDRGYGYGMDDCKAQLASLRKSLTVERDKQHLEMLLNFSERCQESREEGIREERERWESARASQANVASQTDPATTSSISVQTDHLATPTMATASVQMNPPIISLPSSATISTQTEPQLPTIPLSESPLLPVQVSKPPIPITASAPFNWADDTVSLPPIIPFIPLNQPRDLSSLCSSSKNPFSSLRRRHYYPKRQQIVPSCRYTRSYPVHLPTHHTPPILNNHLDWHHDPCLFELSRVLRTLGWSHP